MPDNSSIPITKNPATKRQQEAIRQAVSSAVRIDTENNLSRLANVSDAKTFHEFLSDPAIHAPIYTLPRPLTVEAIKAFITDHQSQREDGIGLLFLNFDENGEMGGYSDITIWPEWSAGELGGAVHPARQGQRRGIKGAKLGFDWMLDFLGLDLICETAALDNDRTAALLDGLGFVRKGEIASYRTDGSERPSLVWEITKAEWKLRHTN